MKNSIVIGKYTSCERKFLRNSAVNTLREKTSLCDFLYSSMYNCESQMEADDDGVKNALLANY
jgi:hypothetical protein